MIYFEMLLFFGTIIYLMLNKDRKISTIIVYAIIAVISIVLLRSSPLLIFIIYLIFFLGIFFFKNLFQEIIGNIIFLFIKIEEIRALKKAITTKNYSSGYSYIIGFKDILGLFSKFELFIFSMIIFNFILYLYLTFNLI